MLRLSIDGKVAVVKTGFSSVLTRNNPFFTDSGDYTFDIALPLEGCEENQKIFGSIHRKEKSVADLVGKRFPFKLQVPPLSLNGKALIKTINEKEVRVQLLAGTSGFNADTLEEHGKDIYIDEMNLGKAYENTFPDAYEHTDHMIIDYVVVTPRSYLIQDLYDNADPKIAYGGIDDTECVNYPVFSEPDLKKANNKAVDYFPDVNTYLLRPNVRNLWSEPFFAAQPFLVNIIERVISQLGYHVDQKANAIRGTWMQDIFIANVRSEYYYNRILPHWTVNEFFDEVRKFFGVFFCAEGKEVSIISKNDFYSSAENYVVISDIVDEHTVNLNEDDDSGDISVGNVGYDFPTDDAIMSLPEEVWENAIIIKETSEAKLAEWIHDHIKEEDKQTSAWVFVDEGTDRCFAFLQSADDGLYHFQQVDCCPPLIRRGDQYGKGKRDIDISLRIVPAKMTWANIDYNIRDINDKATNFDKVVQLPVLHSENSREALLNRFSVDAAINEASQAENKENDLNCIEVALSTGETFRTSFDADGQHIYADVPYAQGTGFVKWADGLWHEVASLGNQHQFNLTNKKAPSINHSVLTSSVEIDTRCVHIFSFIYDGVLNPTDNFLINGKKYACQKLEYTMSENGLSKLVRGYFFEINPPKNNL